MDVFEHKKSAAHLPSAASKMWTKVLGRPPTGGRLAKTIITQACDASEPYTTYRAALQQVHRVDEAYLSRLIAHHQRMSSCAAPE